MDRLKRVIKKENIKYFVVGIIIILLFLLIIDRFRISDLENISIRMYSDKMMTYMSTLEKDDLDHYICYTVVYYKNEYHKNSVKLKEIVEFINNHFDIQVSNKQLRKIGITPYMIEQYITYDSTTDEYIVTTDELTPSVIADIPLIKYDIKKIRKKNRNTYEVVYKQYKVTNPHKVLNIYMDKKDDLAVEDINDYLRGESNRKDIEKYLNAESIGKIRKYVGTIKVQYKISNNNILIFSKKSSK